MIVTNDGLSNLQAILKILLEKKYRFGNSNLLRANKIKVYNKSSNL